MKLWCLHGAVGLAADWNDFKKRMEMEFWVVEVKLLGLVAE